jgi:hypothetical protein
MSSSLSSCILLSVRNITSDVELSTTYAWYFFKGLYKHSLFQFSQELYRVGSVISVLAF